MKNQKKVKTLQQPAGNVNNEINKTKQFYFTDLTLSVGLG